MKFSRVEAPLLEPNELDGIIFKLKKDLNIDPINDKYVVPSSIDKDEDPSILVNWDSLVYSAEGSKKQAALGPAFLPERMHLSYCVLDERSVRKGLLWILFSHFLGFSWHKRRRRK